MKKLFKYLIFGWLGMTIGFLLLYVPYFGAVAIFNKRLATNLVLLKFAKIGQFGINKLGQVYQLIKGKDFAKYILDMAKVNDIKANVANGKMFSDIMLKPESTNLFGGVFETISDNTGENERDGLLTKDGLGLAKFLNFVDKGHTIKAIRKDVD